MREREGGGGVEGRGGEGREGEEKKKFGKTAREFEYNVIIGS